nr:hypothetical protein [Micromonospora sp. NBRC 107566]
MPTSVPVPVFLRALGADPNSVPPDVDEASALYRSLLAERQVLVVLDNAASDDQVRPLLPDWPGCAVLVTSRHRLTGLVARDGARSLTLDVLSAVEADALLRRVLGDRAVAAEPVAATELARRCAYPPLALRVAAANLAVHPHSSIAWYARELAGEDPLATLDGGLDGQAAVQAAFELSYTALPSGARRLFRYLGLVPGHDFGLPAAAALAGLRQADVREPLGLPCAAHLVTEHLPGRYTMHDLLRSFAARKRAADTDPAEVARARRRLVDFYVQTAHEAYPQLLPRRDDWPRDLAYPPAESLRFADRTTALRWHDEERENLIGAIRQAERHGWRRSAWQLADSMFAFSTCAGTGRTGLPRHAWACAAPKNWATRAPRPGCTTRWAWPTSNWADTSTPGSTTGRLCGWPRRSGTPGWRRACTSTSAGCASPRATRCPAYATCARPWPTPTTAAIRATPPSPT